MALWVFRPKTFSSSFTCCPVISSVTRRSVRVNAITPGQVDTPLWRSRLSETEARAHFDRVAQDHPVGRVGTADYVAQAVLFLMTNGFMNGAALDIDGGWR